MTIMRKGQGFLRDFIDSWSVPQAAGPPELHATDIVASYGPIEALHGVSLRCGAGEAVAVLGANGAGKSTLLRTMSGGMRPRSGVVTFAGVDITHRPSSDCLRLGLGLVPEGRQILVKQTVEENMFLGRLIRKDRAQAAQDMEQILDIFPMLREKKRQIAGELSGGQQQMLAIARGLMSNPKMLLLDEPSLGLAPALMEELTELIRRTRQERKMGIVLVEQNVFMAAELTDRAYILQTGRVVSEQKSSEILGNQELLSAYLGARRN